MLAVFSTEANNTHGHPQILVKQRNMLCYFIYHYLVNWMYPSFRINCILLQEAIADPDRHITLGYLDCNHLSTKHPLGGHVPDAVLGNSLTKSKAAWPLP